MDLRSGGEAGDELVGVEHGALQTSPRVMWRTTCAAACFKSGLAVGREMTRGGDVHGGRSMACEGAAARMECER